MHRDLRDDPRFAELMDEYAELTHRDAEYGPEPQVLRRLKDVAAMIEAEFGGAALDEAAFLVRKTCATPTTCCRIPSVIQSLGPDIMMPVATNAVALVSPLAPSRRTLHDVH